jgi:hypothetical protein
MNKTPKIKNTSSTFKLILNQCCKEILKQDQERKKQQERNDLDPEVYYKCIYLLESKTLGVLAHHIVLLFVLFFLIIFLKQFHDGSLLPPTLKQ